jgi:hypothetical protein
MILGEFLLYETEDSKTRVECRFVEGTLWLTQALMAELSQKDAQTINEHLQNIYEEGELEPGSIIRKFRIIRQESPRQVNRNIDHYFFVTISEICHYLRHLSNYLWQRKW